jgi:hypothetical protein
VIYSIELLHCPDPHRVLREAAASLPELAEALAPREVELPDGKREVVAPGTVELSGARVHVIPLEQEMRADGTITPPAAVVIVDGPRAADVRARLDAALLAAATDVRADAAVLPDGTSVVLAGRRLIADPTRREARTRRLARAEALKIGAEPVVEPAVEPAVEPDVAP